MKKNRLLVIIGAIVLCVSMIAFTGCGESPEDNSGDSEAKAETEYPITVEDNDYFKFELTGCDETWGEYKYKITSKMDQDIIFDGEKAVINDETTIDAFIYQDVAAGTSATDSFYIEEEQLADYKDGEELSLKVSYKIYDSESYDDIKSGSFDFTITK